MKKGCRYFLFFLCASLALCLDCGTLPIRQYYVLNFVSANSAAARANGAYPCIVRLKDLDIEDAYARQQIVYRQSPFELRYYIYKLWAVKPSRMVTDLVYKHLVSSNLVRHVTRRFDEGLKPDYELAGTIEAVEEYDSDELWFAHLALRFSLIRLSDGRTVYTRDFDNRKRVYKYSPESVVQEMSAILDFIMGQVVQDLDEVFAKDKGSAQDMSSDSAKARQNGKVGGQR
jgi:ABC-type uncharacterized transport system, auxiliary component